MINFTKKAVDLQDTTRLSEDRQSEQMDIKYSNDRVKLSIVHGREDIILLVSLMNSANEQLCSITVLLRLILIALFVIAYFQYK